MEDRQGILLTMKNCATISVYLPFILAKSTINVEKSGHISNWVNAPTQQHAADPTTNLDVKRIAVST